MQHPAMSMLKVWAACALLYVALPFHLLDRQLTVQGFVALLLFIFAFCAGTLLIKPIAIRRRVRQVIDFSGTENLLAAAGMVTVLAMLVDISGKDIFDLSQAYELRSDQASALLEGGASASSVGFQIGFLTYPAAFVYLVRTIVFDRRPNLLRAASFGALPVLITTLAMGGRSPLLYAILISLFALGARKVYQNRQNLDASRLRRTRPLLVLAIGVLVAAAMYYFVAVFFARAEVVGGASAMFTVAEEIWGVGFRGPLADFMRQAFGDEFTYIIFVFNWYVVQGLVIANYIFSGYRGQMQLGVYGLDLVSALMRRLDGALVARNFDALQQFGTYGFLPSAFGSLYVDFWFWGIIICVVWGLLAGVVFQRIKSRVDSRWLLFAPFVSMGILFSFINTPLGFSNGLVTHLWMLAAFMTSRQVKTRTPAAWPGERV